MRSIEECLRRLAHGSVASYRSAVIFLESENEATALYHAKIALRLIEGAYEEAASCEKKLRIVQQELGRALSFERYMGRREAHKKSEEQASLDVSRVHKSLVRFDIFYMMLMRY
ncbi:MAG: hypothetical protein OSB62_09120 [Alphaproteobacteria bacterium]|nr:hypothetical protein [Alphaproteobacteria bacterium]